MKRSRLQLLALVMVLLLAHTMPVAAVEPVEAMESVEVVEPAAEVAEDSPSPGVTLPTTELPDDSSGAGDRPAMIVYQGRVYVQNVDRTASYNYASFEELAGSYLGTAVPIREVWNDALGTAVYDRYTLLADSSCSVYTVKGYSSSLRLMTPSYDGPMFYECRDGLTIVTGADWFELVGLRGNVRHGEFLGPDAQYYVTESSAPDEWEHPLSVPALDELVERLYAAQCVPLSWPKLDGLESRYLGLVLTDGTIVPLTLYENGVVYSSGLFFQMEARQLEPLITLLRKEQTT